MMKNNRCPLCDQYFDGNPLKCPYCGGNLAFKKYPVLSFSLLGLSCIGIGFLFIWLPFLGLPLIVVGLACLVAVFIILIMKICAAIFPKH